MIIANQEPNNPRRTHSTPHTNSAM